MLDLGGMRTRTDERGAGRCAVYIHGLGGDLQSWDAVWPHLADDRRSIRYDLRGFGQSRATNDAVFTHGQDLEALLDALSIDRCDLIGMSMGGGIALNFALNHPG
jgi:pimeloyl-ACP methyl ester carboxylesterase